MAVEEVPQIPTYKLLPPMYQLAARLGTSGNLNDLVIKVASQLHNCFFSIFQSFWEITPVGSANCGKKTLYTFALHVTI